MPPGPMLETFDRHLPLLFSIAYRMLGSVADAEEAVRRSRLRWVQTASAAEVHVRSPKAYLSTEVIRYCLEWLRAAPSRREGCAGPWLPEHPAGEREPVEEYVDRLDSSLSTAFLSVVKSLTPTERPVLFLRKVFGYGLTEVASFVGESEANCSRIAGRAKRSVVAWRPRFESAFERKEDPE